MTSHPWLLSLAGRHLLPLLLFVFALLTISLRYQHHMGTIVADVVQQESSRLRERLSIDQNQLDRRMGLDGTLVLRRLVGALALHQGLERAYLIDPLGRVRASLSRLDLDQPVADVLAREGVPMALTDLQTAPAPRAIVVSVQADGLALSGDMPLQGAHRLLVWVDNTRAIAVRRAAVQNELLREAVLVLVAVAGLALLLHLLWFRRAQRLSRALEAMGAGDLSTRTGLRGRDELADIAAVADRMAEQLRREQERLRHMNDLINRSPAVVIEWLNQPGWPVVQVSESVRQWGYGQEQLLQGRLHYGDLIHPEDSQRIHEEVANYFAHGPDEYRQSYRIRCADGRWAWVDDRTALGRDGTGQVVNICGVLLDVSAQREAEQAQREQADLLRMFYELPFLGMAISSPTDKRWLQVNDRLCQILGYAREELLRMSWSEMTPPGDLERNVELFDELLAGARDGYRMTKRFLRKDGGIVHAEIDVKALREADGRVRQLYATVQDVTERLQAEANLRRLGAMADNASDALILTVDGHFEDCNAAAVRLFGYPSKADFLGRSPAEMSPPVQPDGRPSSEAAADFIAMAMDGPPQRFEWRHRRRDGSVFDAQVGLVRFQTEDGRPAVIGIVHDITERKAADEVLRRIQEQLEEAQRIGHMGSWDYDMRTGVVTWSEETYRIQEVDPATEPASFEMFLGLIHPDDRVRVADTYQRSVEQHTPYETRYRIVTRSGRTRYLHVRGETQYVQDQPVRSIGMVLDETELVETQRDRDRLVSVLEATSDIVSMADPQGRVFYGYAEQVQK